jgi:hypothetical protein
MQPDIEVVIERTEYIRLWRERRDWRRWTPIELEHFAGAEYDMLIDKIALRLQEAAVEIVTSVIDFYADDGEEGDAEDPLSS